MSHMHLLMTESWMVKDEEYSDYGGHQNVKSSREQISEP